MQIFELHRARGMQDGDGNREIEARAFFLISAGARLTVMLVGGIWKPEFLMAARTRSRLSRTAESGRPTM